MRLLEWLLLLLLSRFSRVRLCATPETAAHQAPPSLGFSRQEHWSGLPFPSPRDLPHPGIEPNQTPHHLSCWDLGRTQNAGPTESAPLRTTRVPEPERLGPGSSAQGPIVTRESRRNSRKTTWLPRHRKMRPLAATAYQEKSHVPS